MLLLQRWRATLLLFLSTKTTLALDPLGNYQPATDVSSHATIAWDQAAMESMVRTSIDDDDNDSSTLLTRLLDVYRKGGNAIPYYARLTLAQPLSSTDGLALGTRVRIRDIEGAIWTAAPVGATQLDVVYTYHTDADAVCRVHFYRDPNTEFCFPSTGRVEVWRDDDDDDDNAAVSYSYVYEPEQDTYSTQSIRQFSTDTSLHHVNRDVTQPWLLGMSTFQAYYGGGGDTTTFADRLVWAALTQTNAGLERGTLDFTPPVGIRAAAEAAITGTVVLHFLLMIVSELEYSVELCYAQRDTTDPTTVEALATLEKEPVRALDKAVAYYVGATESRESTTEDAPMLLYAMANALCQHFNTCQDDDDTMASINEDIFLSFNLLKDIYQQGTESDDCQEAEAMVERRLIPKLQVPLLQATLSYAFYQPSADTMTTTTTRVWPYPSKASGAMIAASILPFVHACNPEDAELVYQEMKLDDPGLPGFLVIKEALERNYECMGVSCAAVGGVFIDNTYADQAEPCTDGSPEEEMTTTPMIPSGGGSEGSVPTSGDGSDGDDSTSSTSSSSTIVSGITIPTYNMLGSYLPTTYVEDHAFIALDAGELDYIVTKETKTHTHDEVVARVASVYQKGGNSRPYARLSLSQTLERTMYKGTPVTVVADGTNVIKGQLMETSVAGSNVLYVLYTSEDNVCRIKFFLRPSIENCFPAAGTIRIGVVSADDFVHEYQYLPADDTFSNRTLQSFSTDTSLHHVMGALNGPLHPLISVFVDYYGEEDYADRIVMAALTRSKPQLAHMKEFDFTSLSQDSFAGPQALVAGVTALHVFMMVVRELEHSLDLCHADLNDDLRFGDPAHAVDKAVAYYKGSLDGNILNNSTEPTLLYELAERMCLIFGTCEDQEARVNQEIFDGFSSLQDAYLSGQPDCAGARHIIYGGLIEKLTVPLIQATIYSAFLQSPHGQEVTADEEAHAHSIANAQGAMLFASILPLLHGCDEDAAALLFDELLPTQTTPVHFQTVRRALERNYECLGVSCFDVGGVTSDGDYLPGYEPCSGNFTSIGADNGDDFVDVKISLTALHVIMFAVLAAVMFVCTSGCILFGLKVAWRVQHKVRSMEKDGVLVDKSLYPDDTMDEDVLDSEFRPTIEIT